MVRHETKLITYLIMSWYVAGLQSKIYTTPILLAAQIAKSGGAIKLKMVPKPDTSVDTESPEFLHYRLSQDMRIFMTAA